MSEPEPSYEEIEGRAASRLMDVLIRAALVGVLVVLCYRIFAPFLALMAWAVVLAVTLYPLQRWLAARLGGRRGLAATLLVLACCLLIIAPTAVLMDSFGSSVHRFITNVQNDTLEIPAPRERVLSIPIVGEKIHGLWSQAHTDLPAFIHGLQPKIGELARKALAVVAGIGIGLLKFLAAFIIAGVLMAYGESGAGASRSIFSRVLDRERGPRFVTLATATIRAVAQGVIGIAFIQAMLVGLSLLLAGVPWAGVLAAITLVLSIAQIPALILILPVIGYIWSSGNYGTGAAVGYTVLLLVAGLADNILKPIMLGRGVDAPMPVVLLGALGGMATGGILGMFVGATLLTIGYQIFMAWVAGPQPEPEPKPATAAKADKSG